MKAMYTAAALLAVISSATIANHLITSKSTTQFEQGTCVREMGKSKKEYVVTSTDKAVETIYLEEKVDYEGNVLQIVVRQDKYIGDELLKVRSTTCEKDLVTAGKRFKYEMGE